MLRFRRISRGYHRAIADGQRSGLRGRRRKFSQALFRRSAGLPRQKLTVDRDDQSLTLSRTGTTDVSAKFVRVSRLVSGNFSDVRLSFVGRLPTAVLLQPPRLRQRLVERDAITWSRKNHVCGCGCQLGPIGADEASNQCQVCELTTGRVPWQPEAVGVSQSRLAVVSRQIFCGEHEFAIGAAFLHALAVIPRIDHQRTLRAYGLMFIDSIEHDSSTDTACGGFAGLVQNGVGPDGYHLPWSLKLRLAIKQSCHGRAVGQCTARQAADSTADAGQNQQSAGRLCQVAAVHGERRFGVWRERVAGFTGVPGDFCHDSRRTGDTGSSAVCVSIFHSGMTALMPG